MLRERLLHPCDRCRGLVASEDEALVRLGEIAFFRIGVDGIVVVGGGLLEVLECGVGILGAIAEGFVGHAERVLAVCPVGKNCKRPNVVESVLILGSQVGIGQRCSAVW